MSPKKITKLIRPETALEKKILSEPSIQTGLVWGEPRFGHPEGKVVYHIREVLDNIDSIPGLQPDVRACLRLVAITHDTFKYAESKTRPRDWSQHHGVLARRFMEQYTQDKTTLDIIEWHDEAYYCWRNHALPHFTSDRDHDLSRFLIKIRPYVQTYYYFFKCDTQTGDKNQAPLRWFEETVKDIRPVLIRERRFA